MCDSLTGAGRALWTNAPTGRRFLAHLAAVERSPNRVRAYAYSLALWFEWLELRGRVWDAAGIEDVSTSVRWLRARRTT
jgi:hypothetical protein